MTSLFFPYTTLATLIVLAAYFWIIVQVPQARSKYGVELPAISGHPDFDRIQRAHMNTLEWIVILLPLMWLFAVLVGDLYAGILGVIWGIARIFYARGYAKDGASRLKPFFVTQAVLATLFLGSLGTLIYKWVM